MRALVTSLRTAPTDEDAERLLRAALVAGVVIATDKDEHGRTAEIVIHSSVRVSMLRHSDETPNT